MTAYYGSGSVASFPVNDDGSLSEATSLHRHHGSGTHPKRQQHPHAHSIFVNPANTYAYAADLGIDKVMIYKMNPNTALLTPAGEAIILGGSMGPRHMKWAADGKTLFVRGQRLVFDRQVTWLRQQRMKGALQSVNYADRARRNLHSKVDAIAVQPFGLL